MKYELAKQLKDSGFPQGVGVYANTDNALKNDSYPTYSSHPTACFSPTLSELMEACNGKWGQRFRWLGNEKTHWSAQARPIHPRSKQYPDSPLESWKGNKDIKTKGSTPEEAVALLWLELNKK